MGVESKDLEERAWGEKSKWGEKKRKQQEEGVSDWETTRVITCTSLPKAP